MNPRETLKERLGPGLWVDMEDNLHISVPELLQEFDLADTAENRKRVVEIAQRQLNKVAQERGVKPPTTVYRTGRCPRCNAADADLQVEDGFINCLKCHWKGQQEHLLER